MFDVNAFTILLQASGGSGSWRMWHYPVVDDTTIEDMCKPGFFGAIDTHLESGSLAFCNAKSYFAVLVVVRRDNVLIARPLCSVDFPEASGAGELPVLQNMPQGTMVHAESELTAHNSGGGPANSGS